MLKNTINYLSERKKTSKTIKNYYSPTKNQNIVDLRLVIMDHQKTLHKLS